ncbi:P-loop ATPase, Sll1717 family [Solibacillus silvestris]
MSKLLIKNIYSGKPDAKDEINFDGLEGFIKTFIVPHNIDLNLLIDGSQCFISGYKGTGKTALLFYLDNLVRERDALACSSFIFFKEEFADLKKDEIDKFAKRTISSITISEDTLLNNSEFEYIWRWLFFKRIVNDNQEFNEGLFLKDENWIKFEKLVSKIKGPTNIKKSIIPNRIKLGIPIKDVSGTTVSPELEVDFSKETKENNYVEFIKLIDEAEMALSKVTKTDIPYHIFVDELEAYYGDQEIFKRDLYLIRDLIFTIKRLNSIFASSNLKNIKIICSIRSEIVNAISRFIVTKELNKVISGFEVPLKWNYNNTNSFSHPIMQILLRRIKISTSENIKDKELIAEWFPEHIHDIEPASYILNNSWHKPRDIVRLIISAQHSIKNDSSAFTQAVFDSLYKQYSLDSLNEIREEMRALYTSEQIEDIINVFTGFKTIFSITQLNERVNKFFKGTIIDIDFIKVLNDLYRLGFIGNFLPASQTYRWQHKGDDRVILSDEWRLMVHHALHSALTIGKRQDYSMKRNELPQIGDVVTFEVKNISKSFVNGFIDFYGKKYPSYIHISNLSETYIANINNYVYIGETIKVTLLEYDARYSKWSTKKLAEALV